MSNHDVAVIGLACAFPRATNLQEYWSNLVNGVDCLGQPPAGRWGDDTGPGGMPATAAALFPHLRGGFLPPHFRLNPMQYGLMPKIANNAEPEQMLMIHIVDQALRDAGVAADAPARQRTDVIIGRGGYVSYRIGEFFLRFEALNRFLASLRVCFPQLTDEDLDWYTSQIQRPFTEDEADGLPSLIPNLVASWTANRLNLRGAAYVVDAACASSLIAVEHAVERLRNGSCDLAVAGGVHLCQIPAFWMVFHLLKSLSPSGHMRPFDRRADGLLLGEGGGAAILKRLADAVRDGDRIYAVVKGVGSSSDGRETGILAPAAVGQVEALRRAYADAGVDPASIGLLEAHGTATVLGDRTELHTIHTFFGEEARPTYSRAMGAVKGNIGHAMPAAGIAAFIKASLSLSNKIWPATLHCQEPLPEALALPFFVNTQTRPWLHPPDKEPRRAGINAFGFGGVNVHCILEEACAGNGAALRTRPVAPGVRRASELFVLAAATPQELKTRIEQVSSFCARTDTEWQLEDLAFTLNEELDAAQPCKLAVLAGNREKLAASLAECVQGVGTSGRRDEAAGVFYAPAAAAPPGKVAFLFPGMAFPGLIGNYPQHLLDLALHFPEVRAALDTFEAKDRHALDPVPFSSILSPPALLPDARREALKARVAPPRTLENAAQIRDIPPDERNLAGVGTVISNWSGWVLLREFQLPLAMTCGNSAGELTALCAGGLLDFETHVRPRLWRGLSVTPEWLGCGCLAYVFQTEEQLQPFLRQHPGVEIAVHVAPNHQVVGGSFEDIAAVVRDLRRQNIVAGRLPFVPGHTSRMSFLRDQIIYDLDETAAAGKPQAAVLCSLTARHYPEDMPGIRELLLGNLDKPVRFWQTNHRLYQEGVRVFVQVGCGTLAANVQSTLPWNDVVATSLDVEYRDPITQLNILCGTLFTAGVPLSLAPLYRHRAPQKLDLSGTAPAPAAPPRGDVPLALRMEMFSTKKLRPRPTPSVLPAPAEGPAAAPVAAVASRPDVEEAPADSAVAESRLPFLGKVVHFVPGQELRMDYTISLDRDLYIEDHHLLAAQDYKPLEHCLPVVPLTGLLEMMAEVAACMAPGLGLVGFEDVRALRWVGLDGVRAVTAQVRVRPAPDQADGIVRLLTEVLYQDQVYSSACVLFAAEYCCTLETPFQEDRDAQPWPFTAAEVYAGRHAFHGPRFQCVTDLAEQGETGFAGELTILPRDELFAGLPDPELLLDFTTLDGAGQLFGLWLQGRDVTAFPLTVDRIEIYRPPPPPGSKIVVRGELTDFSAFLRTATCNLEMQDGEGWVWMRIQGWRDWVQTRSRPLLEFLRRPEAHLLARPVDLPHLGAEDVCVSVSGIDWSSITEEFIAKLCLTEAELADYLGLPAPRGRTYLLGRIAAKDAARQWLSQNTECQQLHPLALVVATTEQGQPYLTSAHVPGPLPFISIAHTEERAIALATRAPVGVDIESVTRNVETILANFASTEEIALLGAQPGNGDPNGAGALKLWCAKEALGKALGIGLADGRPKAFRLTRLPDDQSLTLRHGPNAREYTVFASRLDNFIIAHARL